MSNDLTGKTAMMDLILNDKGKIFGAEHQELYSSLRKQFWEYSKSVISLFLINQFERSRKTFLNFLSNHISVSALLGKEYLVTPNIEPAVKLLDHDVMAG